MRSKSCSLSYSLRPMVMAVAIVLGIMSAVVAVLPGDSAYAASDVTTGSIFVDWNKLQQQQAGIARGIETWRTNPMSVARNDGVQYGLNPNDQYTQGTIIPQYNGLTSETYILVNHQGSYYTMRLVKPFGTDEGLIWYIDNVMAGRWSFDTVVASQGGNQSNPAPAPSPNPAPNPSPGTEVLYTSNRGASWAWYESGYPKTLKVYIVKSQLEHDQIARSLGKTRSDLGGNWVDFDKNIVFIADLGISTKYAYDVDIARVSSTTNRTNIVLNMRSPLREDSLGSLQRKTDAVVLSKSSIDPGTTVPVYDSRGTELGTLKLARSESGETLKHTVKAGETLWQIARNYSTSVDILVQMNNIADSANLRIGQRLSVPGPDATKWAFTRSTAGVTNPDNGSGSDSSGEEVWYTVRTGDSLWKITKTYSTTVESITELNGLSNIDAIYIGQRLLISR